MRIAAVTLHGVTGWPTLKFEEIGVGLSALYGPPRAGKTLVADLLGQTLFGKPAAAFDSDHDAMPPGEVIVESDRGRYRVRRYRDADGITRFTVAALDGSAVDENTICALARGLSPTVLAPLCTVSFREPPVIDALLSDQFAREFQQIGGSSPAPSSSRRIAELTARRDSLAHELETRLAGERRASKELEARWRELDRLVRDELQQAGALEQRLAATESALAETDARLRYRRLELNVELRWHADQPSERNTELDEIDERIAQVRATVSELAQREAGVRARLAQTRASEHAGGEESTDQQAWLAVGRQLAADLAGEVARLARAGASQQCVCRDAHPRLRPIAETIDRQLDAVQILFDEQQRATRAAALQVEVDDLARLQAELQRYLEHLLNRRQALTRAAARREGANGSQSVFTTADAQQLESRRMELEHERFRLAELLQSHKRRLRDLRAQRETVERQRAALLSVRSIDHVQRELATVQQKLEQAAGDGQPGEAAAWIESPVRASDFLAQLTDGSLTRLVLVEEGRRARVVNRDGETLPVESLPADQRDLVYVSLCLALLSAAGRQGIWLPLVLDEPFARLDARGTAALAAVLGDFSRQGHQVLVFTGGQAAAQRLASVGATVHDMIGPQRRAAMSVTTVPPDQQPLAPVRPMNGKKRKAKRNSTDANRSDAA